MNVFIMFLALSIIRGFQVITMKITQKDYLRDINDSIFLIVVISFFQIPFLFTLPPYYVFHFNVDMLIFPLVFSACYLLLKLFMLNSIRYGPTALTSVIIEFSVFVPVILGLFIWDEKLDIKKIIGLLLFIAILFIINSGSYKVNKIQIKISLKWIVMALTAALSAGFAGVTSKVYALNNPGNPKEYLLIYNGIIIIFGVLYFSSQMIRKKYKPLINKRFILLAVILSVLTVGANLLFIINVASFASIYFFPLLSIGAILSVVIMSRLFLKEGLSKKIYIGIILSMVAIYLIK